jgi:hypothetical protein
MMLHIGFCKPFRETTMSPGDAPVSQTRVSSHPHKNLAIAELLADIPAVFP